MISFDLKAHRDQPLYQALLLGGACAVVSLLLIGGNLGTHESISAHQTADKLAMLAQVLPARLYDNDPLSDTEQLPSAVLAAPATLMLAKKDGHFSAAAMQLSIAGWGGIIHMILALNPDGELLGVRIISHTETPGLADKIEREKSDWILSFDGKSLSNVSGWKVKKDGGEFDQFTGATITPRAVVKGVHEALQLYQQWTTTTPGQNALASRAEDAA